MAITGFGYTGTDKLTAADHTAFMAGLFTTGVLRDYLNQLAVTESSPQAMSVDVDTGAFIVGKDNFFNFVRNDSSLTLTIAAADPTNDRHDLVVVTRDDNSGVRASTIEIVQGTPAGSPSDPSLSDTETKKQIAIARVVVQAAASVIADADITDLRTFNKARSFQDDSVIHKTADESVTSSVTLQNDDDFSFAVSANTIYEVHGVLLADGATAGDLDFQWSLPSGATIDGVIFDGLSPSPSYFSEAAEDRLNTETSPVAYPFWATLVVAGTSGTAQLQWAQGTSDATATRMLADSWIIHRQVSA